MKWMEVVRWIPSPQISSNMKNNRRPSVWQKWGGVNTVGGAHPLTL